MERSGAVHEFREGPADFAVIQNSAAVRILHLRQIEIGIPVIPVFRVLQGLKKPPKHIDRIAFDQGFFPGADKGDAGP